MFKKLLRHFKRRVILSNKGIFNWGGEVSGGYESSNTKSRMEQDLAFKSAPEHEESAGARAKWWDLMQQWGGQPGYGAVQPDWGSIWDNAQRKVQQYFWGSATDPGLVGKVKASSARRGVSESPASEAMISRMGATEANVLSDMAVQQGLKEAELSESGRLNYLQSLGTLSGQNMAGQFFTPWQTNDTKTNSWNVNAKVNAGVSV